MSVINRLIFLLMPWLLLLMIIGFVIGMSSMKPMNDYSIQPVPFTSVKVTDEFWAPRIKRNHDVTIPIAFEKSRETGRIKNFKVAGGLEDGSFCSLYPFDDSDVFKIVEGACYSIQTDPDPDLEAYIDTLVYYFGEAQEDDGYLYTNRTILGDSAHKW
ncbi:MAG: glycoside hydrolase family 127 protein, partial [Bacteroidales bacterium]|nr:glycoside hydrolase family 127 protein [Bacteroidales bacterium]